MPRATRLNATCRQAAERAIGTLLSLEHALPPPAPGAPPCRGSRPALYLEEILGDDGQALGVVGDALQVGVLVQDIVVDVQEELQRVLV